MFRILLGLLALVSLANGTTRADAPEAPNVEKVGVSIEVPKKVEFTATKIPGGQTAKFEVKIEIENKENKGIVFSAHYLKFEVLDKSGKALPNFWNWDKPEPKSADALLIDAGKKHQVTKTFAFHTLIPENGEKFSIVQKLYGKEVKKDFAAHVKK